MKFLRGEKGVGREEKQVPGWDVGHVWGGFGGVWGRFGTVLGWDWGVLGGLRGVSGCV